jgi:RNA polymerase sigma-70 factor (ECF subfamily)
MEAFAASLQFPIEREMRDATDLELFKASRAGDERAFHALYDRHQGAVYRFALWSTGSPATAEEVVQEVFLLLIREPQRYDPARGALGAFLYGVARQMVRRSRRRTVVQWEVDENVAPLWIEPSDTLGDLTSRERKDALRQAVLALPLRYREAVTLCHLEGMSYHDAAAVLEVSRGTLCSRLNRARALLVKKLMGLVTCLT